MEGKVLGTSVEVVVTSATLEETCDIDVVDA